MFLITNTKFIGVRSFFSVILLLLLMLPVLMLLLCMLLMLQERLMCMCVRIVNGCRCQL